MTEDFDNHHGPSGDVANRSLLSAAGPKAEAITSKAARAGRRLSVRLKPFGLHNLYDNWIAQVLEQRPGGLRLPRVRTDARGEVDVGLYGGRERADVVQLRVGERGAHARDAEIHFTRVHGVRQVDRRLDRGLHFTCDAKTV